MTGGAERTPRNAPSRRKNARSGRSARSARTVPITFAKVRVAGSSPVVRSRSAALSGSVRAVLGDSCPGRWRTLEGAPRARCHPRWGEFQARDTSHPRQLESPPRPSPCSVVADLGAQALIRRSGRGGSHIRAPARPDVFVQAMIATADRCGPLPQRLSRRPDAPVCAFCALWAGCRSGNRRRAPRTLRRSEAFRPVSGTA